MSIKGDEMNKMYQHKKDEFKVNLKPNVMRGRAKEERMNNHICERLQSVFLRIFLICALIAIVIPMIAVHSLAYQIDPTKDVVGLRGRMSKNEGYLSYAFTFTPYGEERTGWTDIRHPAQATLAGQPNATDTAIGYDRSDHFVNARTTILTDTAGNIAPSGGIPDDFHFANKAWAQAGLSVIEVATRPIALPASEPFSDFGADGNPRTGDAGEGDGLFTPGELFTDSGADGNPGTGDPGEGNGSFDGDFRFPLSHGLGPAPPNGQMGHPREEQNIMTNFNDAAAGTVEVYYTGGLLSGALGETYFPSHTAGGQNEAIFLADTSYWMMGMTHPPERLIPFTCRIQPPIRAIRAILRIL